MSAYVIMGREIAENVAVCLRQKGMAETPVLVASKGQGTAALEEAARVPVDVLLLDIDVGPGLGSAVLRYRLARPNTRVVLLAPGRVPGDADVAAVVQAGVYNVVTDLEELGRVLEQPPAQLAAAALWLDPSLAPVASRREQVRERVVERRVAVSQRPVLIVVAGMAPGVGTTTAACTLAGYLTRRGYRTVLVEAGDQPSLGMITEMELDEHTVRWLPNLDVCLDPTPRNLVRARQHAYVVADLGDSPCGDLERVDADLILVVLPQAHRIQRAVAWLRAASLRPGELEGYRYMVLGSKETGGKVISAWQAICSQLMAAQDERVQVSTYLLPFSGGRDEWPPGYRHRNEELDRACGNILAEVLPDTPRKRGIPWFPFKRRTRHSGAEKKSPRQTPGSHCGPKPS